MRDTKKFFATLLVTLLLCSVNVTITEAKDVDWNMFSKGLNMALQSSKSGLQQSAMHLVVKYGGDRLNLKESLDDVITIYRKAEDTETRELAILTIYQIDKKKAAKLLLEELESGMEPARAKIDALRASK